MAENPPAEPRGHISLPGPQFLPPDITQSGWERVRALYRRNDDGELPQEAEFMKKAVITGMLVGLVYGGVPAARYSRQQYIKNHQAAVYQHRAEAVRAAHNAAIRGFIRYGVRWGWRIAAFTTIFNVVSTGLSAYRDKVVMSHFAAAGAVSGGLFRINMGLKGVISGSVIGTLLGIPMGVMISGLQALIGEDLQEHKRRQRHLLYEEKLQEWGERMSMTDDVVREMEDANAESAVNELEKISKILQQHRIPDCTPEK